MSAPPDQTMMRPCLGYPAYLRHAPIIPRVRPSLPPLCSLSVATSMLPPLYLDHFFVFFAHFATAYVIALYKPNNDEPRHEVVIRLLLPCINLIMMSHGIRL